LTSATTAGRISLLTPDSVQNAAIPLTKNQCQRIVPNARLKICRMPLSAINAEKN
jgi:hypothetical protein